MVVKSNPVRVAAIRNEQTPISRNRGNPGDGKWDLPATFNTVLLLRLAKAVSRNSIADEMYEQHRRRVLGE